MPRNDLLGLYTVGGHDLDVRDLRGVSIRAHPMDTLTFELGGNVIMIIAGEDFSIP